MVFPKSAAAKRLDAFCERFGVSASARFYGFHAGAATILFRQGNSHTITVGGKEYWRWSWTKPSGSDEDRRACKYILYVAPECPESSELFFIVPAREALNIFGEAQSFTLYAMRAGTPSAHGEKFWQYRMDEDKLRRELARLEKTS